MTKIELKSARGIDYQKLEHLLAGNQWEHADQETHQLMLQGANKTDDHWLSAEDIQDFPCIDLQTIDQLWVKYSHHRFGFSVQQRIYQKLNHSLKDDYSTWQAFGTDVGWRIIDEWLYYRAMSDLEYAITLEGHFPRTFVLEFTSKGFDDFFQEGWFGQFWLPTPILLSRVAACKL